MGTDSIFQGDYIVCKHSNETPNGAMVVSYKTREEAENYVDEHKYDTGNRHDWSILYIISMEWVVRDYPCISTSTRIKKNN